MNSSTSQAAPGFAHAKPVILAGLIGENIGPSRSPDMHMAEADAAGLRMIYQRLDLHDFGSGVEALPELLRAAELMGFAGLNITHPCKQKVIPLLDELSVEAAALGAVNTVVFSAGKRIGHNTDWRGFSDAFQLRMAGAGLARIVQLGAGGAGAAVAYGVLRLGAEQLTIVDADPARAEALAASLSAQFGAGRAVAATAPGPALAEADGLINSTPVGMAAHPGLPLEASLLRPSLWVAEIVYFPLETALLAAARALGCRTIDGGGMAVLQAAAAFHLFTGVAPDIARMMERFAAA